MISPIRIDKWLWAVRLFKTRNQASEACRKGKVAIGEQTVKPSREVKLDDIISVRCSDFKKIVQVKGLIKNRVSAKLAVENFEDHTTQQEYNKKELKRQMNYERRDKGIGRPTKKQRREIEILKKKLKSGLK